MQRNSIISIVLAVVAVVIAWWLVGLMFTALRFVLRLLVVGVLALIIYFAVSHWLRRPDRRD